MNYLLMAYQTAHLHYEMNDDYCILKLLIVVIIAKQSYNCICSPVVYWTHSTNITVYWVFDLNFYFTFLFSLHCLTSSYINIILTSSIKFFIWHQITTAVASKHFTIRFKTLKNNSLLSSTMRK